MKLQATLTKAEKTSRIMLILLEMMIKCPQVIRRTTNDT